MGLSDLVQTALVRLTISHEESVNKGLRRIIAGQTGHSDKTGP